MVTNTMVGGEPTPVFRRVPDLQNTLAADNATNIGLLYSGLDDEGEP